MFGVKRNVFDDRYHALRARAAEGQAPKAGGVKQKKGRKEICLADLDAAKQKLFTGHVTF